MTRVLVISSDTVGEEMAGPGIRAYELARALQPHATVTLAAVESPHRPPPGVEVMPYHRFDQRALRPLIGRADAVVCQPQWPVSARWLRASGARLIFDVYDPEPFETLEFLRQPRGGCCARRVHTMTRGPLPRRVPRRPPPRVRLGQAARPLDRARCWPSG